jgi:hypothetical protein
MGLADKLSIGTKPFDAFACAHRIVFPHLRRHTRAFLRWHTRASRIGTAGNVAAGVRVDPRPRITLL